MEVMIVMQTCFFHGVQQVQFLHISLRPINRRFNRTPNGLPYSNSYALSFFMGHFGSAEEETLVHLKLITDGGIRTNRPGDQTQEGSAESILLASLSNQGHEMDSDAILVQAVSTLLCCFDGTVDVDQSYKAAKQNQTGH